MRFTLPNILTILRLVAALALPILFVVLPRPLADWIGLVLFLGAAATDWFDGYYARRYKIVSRFGTMLDPIADKAMVTIAFLVLIAISEISGAILIPAAIVVFRETFVSGLREFLGPDAKKLAVTRMAKWKTTFQMVAISAIFAHGIVRHHLIDRLLQIEDAAIGRNTGGVVPDEVGLTWLSGLANTVGVIGITLLWIAAGFTIATGWDYLRKAWPYIKDPA